MDKVTAELRRLLKDQADEQTRESSQHFFKEPIKVYGVKSQPVRKIAKQLFNSYLKEWDKGKIFTICEKLWKSGYQEEIGIACEWSYAIREKFEPADFAVLEKWLLNYVSNWAACDILCNHTMAAFVEKYPEFLPKIKKWTLSKNRWARRGAAVTFIIPARNGLWLGEMLEIATALMKDADDMVQKGYGWLLKAASEAHPKEVFDFVMAHKKEMPRTAFRYSLEKMPKEWRAEAMRK